MPDSSSLTGLLRQMPIFGGLKNSTLEYVLELAETVDFSAGNYLFREGDSARSLFVIRNGKAVVEKDWQGQAIQLGEFGDGDCLGEMAIIDLQPRSASVRAETDLKAIEITHTILHGLYQSDLEQYAIIMMNMGREVSRRLRSSCERLFSLEQALPF